MKFNKISALKLLATGFVMASLFGCAGPKQKNLDVPDKIFELNITENINFKSYKGLLKVEYEYTLTGGRLDGLHEDRSGVYYHCEGRCVKVKCDDYPFNNGEFEGGLWVSKTEPKTFRLFTVINDDKKIGKGQGALVRGLVLLDIGRVSKHSVISDEPMLEILSEVEMNKVVKAM
ncbi:MAG: hypothetical protein K6L81_06150 [Agarilytica sp.]